MIMSWISQWKAISARISGFIQSCELYFLSIQTVNDDPYGTRKKVLLPESESIYEVIDGFYDKYKPVLPSSINSCLNEFVLGFQQNFAKNPNINNSSQLPFIKIRVIALCSLKSQIEYLLSDSEHQIRSTTERAFLHLQRCIVADQNHREKWKNAFRQGETHCEKLGATHLLWHGIWAFKANARGGRTDLVLGNNITNPAEIERSALGLVLTEWKLAENEEMVQTKYQEGQAQAKNYSSGILSGIELSSPRYVVLLTKKTSQSLEDRLIDSIAYRFVNIAVDPDPPSLSSKKKKNRKGSGT